MIQIKLKHFFILISLFVAFACGVYVKSALTPSIAVIDLDRMLREAPKLESARQENEAKLKEFTQWIEEVNKEIADEKNPVKYDKLVNQYRKLAGEKEMMIRQEYNNRINEFNGEITAVIHQVAEQRGCNLVFAITSIIDGGEDITDDVIKELK